MIRLPENRNEKGPGTRGRAPLGVPQGAGYGRRYTESLFSSAQPLLLHTSLSPLAHGSFSLMTLHTQGQLQHCHSIPIHASSLSVPLENYSNLWFPILKPWSMTDMASHFLNPGHKSQSPEWTINQLLWNQKSTLNLLNCDQGWAAMCR